MNSNTDLRQVWDTANLLFIVKEHEMIGKPRYLGQVDLDLISLELPSSGATREFKMPLRTVGTSDCPKCRSHVQAKNGAK